MGVVSMFARYSARLALGRVQATRSFSSSFAPFGKALIYSEYGAPERVLELKEEKVRRNCESEVLVNMLAATINPADMNMIQGTYGSSQSLPAVAGNEGVGVVVEPGLSSFQKGDWVIPAQPGYGTWRTEFFCYASELIKIRNDIPMEYAAGISSNPCTAYRLLSDFGNLTEGDVVIQNAANSNVGQCVTQIANARGIKVINVVRSRDDKDMEQLKKKMKEYGADYVVTEEELVSPKFDQMFKDLPKPKLAINAVGGSSATNIAKRLGSGGVMVAIGGMSRKPILIPTGAMIFKDLTFEGFWMTRWTQDASVETRAEMLRDIQGLIREKKLKLWYEFVPLDSYKEAIARANKERQDVKLVFKMH